MKRFTLFYSVLLTLIFALSNCSNASQKKSSISQAVEEIVEFKDANFKAYILENFDLDKDGSLSLSEALKIKKIDCSDKQIFSLSGIETFENLEFLDCSNNQIGELELSKNKKLEKLICTNNKKPMALYFSEKSPIRDQEIEVPIPPGVMVSPLDSTKVTFDREDTQIFMRYN